MQYIQTLKALNFSIIPVARASKKSTIAWTDFTSRLPTAEELDTWFGDRSPDDGGPKVGIVTGAVSGIIVLDVDGEAGEESLKKLGELPLTPTVRTGKGRHFYFRHPGGEVRNFAGRLPGIDLRGDGGYVVLHRPSTKTDTPIIGSITPARS